MKYIIFILFITISYSGNLERLYYHSTAKIYKPINKAQFSKAKRCFIRLFKSRGKNSQCLKDISFKKIDLNGSKFALIDTTNSGRGFYLFNTSKYAKDMLSLPHRFFDRDTGVIGMRLFRENRFRVASFNTVNRHIVDLAHTKLTIFNALHIAYAKVYPRERIYQIHGFANKYRKSKEGKSAKLIISNSDKPQIKKLKSLKSCLSILTDNIYLFSIDINELGALTNAQYNSLKKLHFRNFFHLEHNRWLRNKLKISKTIRKEYARCLLSL